MPDLETQLRDYFDAAVERVTAEDVLAGWRVYETTRPDRKISRWRPAWVAAGAFAATVTLLGGGLVLGAVLTGPSGDLGSGGLTDVVHEATAAASDWWPLIAAIVIVFAIAGALTALNRRHHTNDKATEEDDTMATTIEAPPAESTGTVHKKNRGLIVAVVVLAVALLALGAWAIYQQTAESEAAAPAEVNELLSDYWAAWNSYDSEAFLALTTEDYVQDTGFAMYNQTETAELLPALPDVAFQVEPLGDPIVADDAVYYVAVVHQFSGALAETQGAGEAADGISTFVMVDTADGLKVQSHVWTGRRLAWGPVGDL